MSSEEASLHASKEEEEAKKEEEEEESGDEGESESEEESSDEDDFLAGLTEEQRVRCRRKRLQRISCECEGFLFRPRFKNGKRLCRRSIRSSIRSKRRPRCRMC